MYFNQSQGCEFSVQEDAEFMRSPQLFVII